MENFFDQYGKVLIVVVIVMALIAVAVIFKDQIGSFFTTIFNSFSSKALDGTGITGSLS